MAEREPNPSHEHDELVRQLYHAGGTEDQAAELVAAAAFNLRAVCGSDERAGNLASDVFLAVNRGHASGNFLVYESAVQMIRLDREGEERQGKQ